LESPVKSRRFPDIGGEFLLPESLDDLVPAPRRTIACTVHVEKQGGLQRGVKVNLVAEIVAMEGAASRVLGRSRKTNITGTAFFREVVPDQSPNESLLWTAGFKRKNIDHAAGSCRLRSFRPCAETDETGCLENRYAVTVDGAFSLGAGQFDLGGNLVRVAITNLCRRQSNIQVRVTVEDDFGPAREATLTVVDVESGARFRRDDLTLMTATTIQLSWPDSICNPHLHECRSPCP
jgi:hypothetical protein